MEWSLPWAKERRASSWRGIDVTEAERAGEDSFVVYGIKINPADHCHQGTGKIQLHRAAGTASGRRSRTIMAMRAQM